MGSTLVFRRKHNVLGLLVLSCLLLRSNTLAALTILCFVLLLDDWADQLDSRLLGAAIPDKASTRAG
jgi:hypothetical protein